ncbi:MAG TPA: hypothetical protein VMQ73_07050 [Methylomirabilota bacterium]|nr:hypothetical protein [Methylomirabilota bacterium]
MMGKFWQVARSRIAVAALVVLPALAVLATSSMAALAGAIRVELRITLGDGDNKVDGGGRFYLDNGNFHYAADHLTFDGKVTGDSFTLDGVYESLKPKTDRQFTLAGKIVNNHFSGAVKTPDGKVLGSLSFELMDE